MDFLVVELYLFDEFISIGTHIIHSVPVHGKIGFKSFMFLQQALETKSQIKTHTKKTPSNMTVSKIQLFHFIVHFFIKFIQ